MKDILVLKEEFIRLIENITNINSNLQIRFVENRISVVVKRNRDAVIEIDSRKSEMKYSVYYRFPVEYSNKDLIDFSGECDEIISKIKEKVGYDMSNIYFKCKDRDRGMFENEFHSFRETAKINKNINVMIIDSYITEAEDSNIIVAEPIDPLKLKLYDKNIQLKDMGIKYGNMYVSSQSSFTEAIFYIYGSFKRVKSIQFKDKEFLLWAFSKDGWAENVSHSKNIILFEFNKLWTKKGG